VTGRDDPRTPLDLAEQLADADLLDTFEAMAPSHRREYIDWITKARQDVTRRRRITGTIERLTRQRMGS
jgi:uncharacterized protein YdeI (YjbR/CyaY-like superfamily)